MEVLFDFSKGKPLFHQGRFRLTGSLGRGAFAQVYSAEDILNKDRRVALKFINLEKLLENFLITDLINEIKILASLEYFSFSLSLSIF